MKKLIAVVLVLAALGLSGIALKYAYDSRVFEKFPEAEYLSSDEAELRPYYRQLTKSEKAVYEAIYRGMLNYEEAIDLPSEIDGDTYSKIYCMLEKQEGALFYIDSSYYTADALRTAQIIYRTTEKDAEGKTHELEMAVKEALRGMPKKTGDAEAARYIHDYLIANCKYVTDDTSGYTSTAYGCLVNGRANCEGYAKAFDLLAAERGIESVLITGTTDEGENHAWNQVRIGDEWYNLDVTWDDGDSAGATRWTYCLCSDSEIRRTHFPDNEDFEPFECDRAFVQDN